MKKEISVSFYQALVLLMFNNSDKLSYQEILESTQIGKNTRVNMRVNRGFNF